MPTASYEWPAQFEALLRRHCRLVSADRPIDADALLPSLGVDSLEVIELIVSIEDTFELSVPTDLLTAEVFATPGSIWRHVRTLIAQPDRLDANQHG